MTHYLAKFKGYPDAFEPNFDVSKAPCLSRLIKINKEIFDCCEQRKQPIPQIPEIIGLIQGNLKVEFGRALPKLSEKSLNCVSWDYNEVHKENVVNAINVNTFDKYSFNPVRSDRSKMQSYISIEDIIDYLGEEHCSGITSLNLNSFSFEGGYENLDFLKHFPNLKKLVANGPCLTNISGLSHCTKLKILDLDKCRLINDLTPIKNLKHLEDLSLVGHRCQSLNFISECKKLKILNLDDCRHLIDISDLEFCPKLIKLNLTACWNISNFSCLNDCEKLEILILNLLDINSFNGLVLKQLKELSVLECDKLTDISALKDWKNLQFLICSPKNNIKDFSSIHQLPNCKLKTKE